MVTENKSDIGNYTEYLVSEVLNSTRYPVTSAVDGIFNGTINAYEDGNQSTPAAYDDVPQSSTRKLFAISVICIATVGTLANGLVLSILARSKKQRNSVHVLILNQLSLDLFSSVSLAIVYSWKMINPKFSGTLNFVLCVLVGSEDILWIGLNGSIFNLMFMTWERYLKIVFPIFYRNCYRKWFNLILIALAWISSFLMNFLGVWTMTDFTDDGCIPYSLFPSTAFAVGVSVYMVLLQEILPVLTFLICYAHIIVVIRRSGNMFKEPESQMKEDSVQTKNNKNERSVIKIMVTVAGMFILCWTPVNIYFVLMSFLPLQFTIDDPAWYVSMIMGFMTISIQPFIYVHGLKSEAIKNGLFKCCHKEPLKMGANNRPSEVTQQIHI